MSDNQRRRKAKTPTTSSKGGQITIEGFEGFGITKPMTTMQAVKNAQRVIVDALYQVYSDELALLSSFPEDTQDLAPFISDELTEAQAQGNPQFDCFMLELWRQGFDADGTPIKNSPFREIIERGAAKRSAYTGAEAPRIAYIKQLETHIAQYRTAQSDELPRIISRTTSLMHYPLDKPNSKIWNLLASADSNGQLSLDILTNKKGSKQDAVVMYGIDFSALEPDLKITRQLTHYDKRVYTAAAALWNGGNSIISATQIYKMMGNAGNPKSGDLQRVNDSLTKMGAAHTYLDSTRETAVNKNYPSFKYDASLLPFERISAYINGQLVDSAIHLFREPPLITFARERGQITTLTRQLLESPISKTDANLQLEDYLLERIGHMKSPKSKAPRKMLFTTIYERCNITTKKQRQRAPEKIQRYLDHYRACKWIDGYVMDKDGITIEL